MQKEFIPERERREEYLKRFGEKYPQYESGIIGRSILGKDIDYYKIGSGRRHIVAVGAHHGTEYITASVLYDFIDFLCEKATRGASWNGINLPFLLQKFTYWIIPCLNPDGVDMRLCGIEKTPLYERQLRMNGGSLDFSEWRGNARGVDLEHNYNRGFSVCRQCAVENAAQSEGAGYSGDYPESEPETKSLANFLRALSPAALVSLHSEGGYFFAKPESEYVIRVAERLAPALGYKSALSEGHAPRGTIVDYTGETLGIPSFFVPVCRGEKHLADSNCQGICDTLRKLLVFLPTRL